MESKRRYMGFGVLVLLVFLFSGMADARSFTLNARSAILIDTSTGRVLYEQNADSLIPPASVTKLLTLYLVLDAIREGQIHLWDKVPVSSRAAKAPPSRMGLKAGKDVSLDELIKGAAVVSGNDACVAMAEYLGGSVENFVRRMNMKARELGMTSTVFKTPNGLPADGQLTTARDLAKLSIAYLKRFPEALAIHSMRSYTYNNATHRNPNRLLGRCPGVDGLKTGFVCASGYNLSATAKRDNVRLLAVVLGAPSPGVRATETTRLLEYGYRGYGTSCPPDLREVDRSVGPGERANVLARARAGASGAAEPARKRKIVRKINLAATAPAAHKIKRKEASISSKKTAKKTASAKAAQKPPAKRGAKLVVASLAEKAPAGRTRAVKDQKASKMSEKTRKADAKGKPDTRKKPEAAKLAQSVKATGGKKPAAGKASNGTVARKAVSSENLKLAGASSKAKKSGKTVEKKGTCESKPHKQAASHSVKKSGTDHKSSPSRI